MPNGALSKQKRKKNLGGYAVSVPICQTFKTNKIMETVKLNYTDWAAVAYAMKGKIESLKELGLTKDAEHLNNILKKIEKQIK